MTRIYYKEIQLGDNLYTVAVYYKGTRDGFYHRAYTYEDCNEIASYRASYLNRTWEGFAGQSAIKHAIARCPKAIQEILLANMDTEI